jgi:sugar phosphate isomerase/epimerase
MRTIGFSTGALARGDFRHGLALAREHGLRAVELSALRPHELPALMEALPDLDLTGFEYVSLHAPSQYEAKDERGIAKLLERGAEKQIPVIIHPDAIHDAQAWRDFGALLLIENMDRRKPVGRSAEELAHFFDLLPDAGFCFDIGHARQFDPSMTEAVLLMSRYKDRLRQLHVSEVNSFSRHERLSWLSWFAFQRIAGHIPEKAPIIVESVVQPDEIRPEIEFILEALEAPSAADRPKAATPKLNPVPAAGD